MKKLKLFLCFILILTMLFTSVGCWNYEDVDQLFIVSGIAIDKDMETGEYLISFEVIKAKGGGDAQMGVKVVSVRSDTVFDGIRDAIQQIGKKLYWGHTTVCVVGNAVVKEGLFLTLDSLARATDLKADIFICYSDLNSLEEIFNFQDEIHDTISGHLVDLFNESLSSGKYVSAPLYKVLKELSGKNGTILLPVLTTLEKEEPVLIVNGSVAVTKDNYIGYVDETETKSVELIRNADFKQGYGISMKANNYVPGAAVEVIDTKRKIEPVLEGDQLKMKIELELECELAELESPEDYISDARKGELENGFEQLIKERLSSTIDHTQKEFGKDIFNFHTTVFQQLPNYWREVQDDWDETFRTMSYDIYVDMNIYSSEANKKPLGYTGE